MNLEFERFAVDVDGLPEGEVRVRFVEAMMGEGPDGEQGLLGTGNEFNGKMTADVAKALAIELAIASGMMKDHSKPIEASIPDMRKAVSEQERQERIKRSRKA
jgi:hypothetical protein